MDRHKNVLQKVGTAIVLLLLVACATTKKQVRIVEDFNKNWNFKLGDYPTAIQSNFNTADWKTLQLPHDWSIEGAFNKDNPTKQAQAFLPAGKGWYRKTFTLPEDWKNKNVSIEFDGVFKNSEVFINGHSLGIRPNGYISFTYELSPYLHFGTQENIIAVKVDNDAQPNSRWYTGSGIYRNVRLVASEKLHVAKWGTYVTTPEVSKEKASVHLEVTIENKTNSEKEFQLVTSILDANNKEVANAKTTEKIGANTNAKKVHNLNVNQPKLWDTENPNLYKIVTTIYENSKAVDNYETPLGFRFFNFDSEKGFSLNGVATKILGVCLHHDNGALGAVENIHAVKRKLTILKQMGTNAIRMAHNPHSLEMMQLCDEMGFIVQAEFTDVWKKKKVTNDYHKDWDAWHKQDLEDFIKRDRNHPSVMMWSIGNEIREQFDSTGIAITRELAQIVKSLDTTRPVTSALTENVIEKNFIYQSGALDLLGFNYKHEDYKDFPTRFKGQKIIASESVSALETRGHYDFPSDGVKAWPPKYGAPFDGNADWTVTAYDQVKSYWGATHEDNWKTIKKQDFMAGTFIWTGFDYLGEPDPYPYPARSSYFGIVDLAGFPKDVYYMYQSEWTTKPVLHIFPHWNWTAGQEVDVWVYYNNADEVELFLNGKSLGKKSKQNDDLHISWRVKFEPGTIKAISRKNGVVVLEKEIHTAGAASKIALVGDKQTIKNDSYDLVYVTVSITDADGNMVPNANNLINFEVSGGGKLVGVDNGYQAGLDSFKANFCKVYNGKCIAIIQSNGKNEAIQLKASTANGISSATIDIKVQ
ncbi:sugar-binding domain-containing protein [Flavobacterium yafengii]|uniref:Glycoside hydrolase family 2 TIM barrel-domain containing protein n=1 Tax=Flavobacterium yafengii TaxID=3041253 RepID=A0AAW6TQ08_9FLAO|nr:sugar-binding domain-containing protein [Flavobacterium yafengii]MDI5949920.1 glycoside hydrolase family 2 TIM barrel-domain containing protein [Flavobacterium yafengii]